MFVLVIFFKTDIVYLIILIGGFKDVLFAFDGLYFGMIPNDSSIFFITSRLTSGPHWNISGIRPWHYAGAGYVRVRLAAKTSWWPYFRLVKYWNLPRWIGWEVSSVYIHTTRYPLVI